MRDYYPEDKKNSYNCDEINNPIARAECVPKIHMWLNVNKNKDTCWNYFSKGEDKGEWWRGWIQVWYIWYIVRNSVNATKYPHPAQYNKNK
jgi:hypothetical protein